MFWHQHVYTDGGPDLLADIVMVLVSSYTGSRPALALIDFMYRSKCLPFPGAAK